VEVPLGVTIELFWVVGVVVDPPPQPSAANIRGMKISSAAMAYTIFHRDAWGPMAGVDAPHAAACKRKTKIKSKVPSATVIAPGKAGVRGNLREVILGATIARGNDPNGEGRRSADVENYGGRRRTCCAQRRAGAGERDSSVVVEARCELQRVVGGLTRGDAGRERGRRTSDRKRRWRAGQNI